MSKRTESITLTGLQRQSALLAALQCAMVMGWALTGGAVPASPEPVLMRQPDGTTFLMHRRGDEFLHWDEDARGYTVMKEHVTGSWRYARRKSNGELEPTAARAGKDDPEALGVPRHVLPAQARDRAQAKRIQISRGRRDAPQLSSTGGALAPSASSSGLKEPALAGTTGTMKNLVLMLEFPDLSHTFTTNAFDALFNEVGYTTDGAVGSVKDYYKEVSYNTLTVDSVVTAWITLDNGYAYYGDGFDRVPGMVAEGLEKLDALGFDFSTLDNDGDGYVDGLTVIHAGWGQEYTGNSSNYIWSHKGNLSSTVTYDGTSMYDYHTEPELRGAEGTTNITRIGVICHENGHFLGLPDLYDYGGDSSGAGDFAMMARGCWNGVPVNDGNSPAHYCAWSKKFLGWVTPTVISGSGRFTLPRVEDNATVYRLNGASPFPLDEYFLIENRQGEGFDAGLPGTTRGMLIWHVDDSQTDNDDQTHYWVDLEEASGTQELELGTNYGDDSDYYRAGNATTFTDATTPNSDSYDSHALGEDVTDVSSSGSNMWLELGGGQTPGPNTTNTVSYSESFETVAVGSTVPGTNGWSAATFAAATVTNDAAVIAAFDAYAVAHDAPLSEGHSRYLAVSADTTNAVVSADNAVIYVDALLQALRMPSTPEVDDAATVHAGMAFDASGHPEVYHYDVVAATNRWTVLDDITVAEDAVVRMTLCCDYGTSDPVYGRRYFRLWVDAESATNALAFTTNDGSGAAGGTWFAMPCSTPPTHLSRLEILNQAVIDEMVIKEQAPFAPSRTLLLIL